MMLMKKKDPVNGLFYMKICIWEKTLIIVDKNHQKTPNKNEEWG